MATRKGLTLFSKRENHSLFTNGLRCYLYVCTWRMLQETYSLDVDNEKQTLVLRTTNKKYFKVFQVPALLRAGMPLRRSSANMSHNGGSTLVISYEKPGLVVEEESEARASAMRDGDGAGVGAILGKELAPGTNGKVAAPVSGTGGSEGAPECSQS